MNLNRVILTGNLTADPELRTTASGTSVCDLRIACSTRRKDSSSGEWVDKPNYFNVVVWAAQAENAARYLTKGRPVAIDGRLEWREWDTQDGTRRQAVLIVADTVQYLGSARALDTTSEEPTPERRTAEIPTPAATTPQPGASPEPREATTPTAPTPPKTAANPQATEPQTAETAQDAPAAD